jgi:hypothetical protein
MCSKCKNGAIAQFKLFLATTQAKIHIISYLCHYCFDHGLDGRWIGSTVRDFSVHDHTHVFSSYAINCYVVGSCHGLSWFSTLLTLLWTSIFFLKLFVGGLVV